MKFFSELFEAFEKHGESLFAVGGAVRDLMSARTADEDGANKFSYQEEVFWEDVQNGLTDVDFATSALPEKTIQILKANKMKVIPIGLEFGTIQTFIKDIKVEITTFRTEESYKKGSRKPDVKFGKSLEMDLSRRDFSVNAMAMDKDGTLIDPFGGLDDLINRNLRTPQMPEISFGDDPLRMLRAARFAAKLGFIVQDNVEEAMWTMRKEIKNISGERVFQELSKVLMSQQPGIGLQILAETGVLGEIMPEMQTVIDFKQNQGKWHSKLVWPHTIQVVENTPPVLEVRWAALMHDVAKPQTYSENEDGSVHFYGHDWKGALIWDQVADRLRVSKEFRDHVHVLVYEHLQPSLLSTDGVNHCSNKALRKFVHRVGDKLENLFLLSLADITSHKPDVVKQKRERCSGLFNRIKVLMIESNIVEIKLPTGLGTTLGEQLGLQGKALGDVMKALREKLIEGDLTLESDFVAEARKII